MERAAECCREILHHVNQAVRDIEDWLVSLRMALGLGQWDGCVQRLAGAFVLSTSGPLLRCSGLALGLFPSGSLWVSPSPWVVAVTLPSLPQRLKDYQKRLDLSHLRQSSDPMLNEFKVPHLPSPPLPCLPLPSACPDPLAPGSL